MGLKKLESDGFLSAGETTDTILKRLIKEPDLKKAMEHADFVIEAVPEVMEIKKEVYKKLGEFTPRNTVIASNTSTMMERYSTIESSSPIWPFTS